MQDLVEWLTILIRWGHVMAGIAWIGTSFYFNWFDLSVRKPDLSVLKENVRGTLHEIHGGNFYYHEQYWPDTDHPRTLAHAGPSQLTLLSGLALFAILYWYGASLYLIDPQVADLSKGYAIIISVASLALAWPLYNKLCRTCRSDITIFIWMSVLTVCASWFFTNLFGGRAAFIHVGAVLGIIMALNVQFVIAPNHIAMRGQLKRGLPLDASLGAAAKRVSQHNNYFTLPVVFTMVSIHFPLASGHPYGWMILSLIMGFGVTLRHYRNVQFKTDTENRSLLVAAFIMLAAAIGISQMSVATSKAPAEVVSDPVEHEILLIVQARCTSCHSASPTNKEFTAAPLGFRLDTLAQLKAGADKVLQRAVRTRDMPLNNVTTMTEEERRKLADWLSSLQASAR